MKSSEEQVYWRVISIKKATANNILAVIQTVIIKGDLYHESID